MKPAVTLAETTLPGGTTLSLIEHDGEFYLQSDGIQLQSTFAHGAVEELARLACAPFQSARQPRLLFAGLGLGYTLAAARAALPQKRAAFVVAEPLPDLPAWHRSFLGNLHPGQLDDPRLDIRSQTLAAVLKKAPQGFQVILLDTESSPRLEGVTDRNGLLRSSFLNRAHSALKEGGLLAVRCSLDPASIERRLRQAGFDVAHESVPASHKGKQKRRSTIWLARKGTYQPRSVKHPDRTT
ncbi:MAG: spermidine synthase [Akkermansiaceae bacterium]|nr:spermidine synthase [Akkermansiaceae bacterium]